MADFLSFVWYMMGTFVTVVNSVKFSYKTMYGNTIQIGAFNILLVVLMLGIIISVFVKGAKT